MTDEQYEEMQQALKHDWEILKAKFLISKGYDFNLIKKDVVTLAQLGFEKAVILYCASLSIEKDELVEQIVADSYPQMSAVDIAFGQMFHKYSQNDLDKARLRLTNEHKSSILLTPQQALEYDTKGFLSRILSDSEFVREYPTCLIISFFENIASEVEGVSDGAVVMGYVGLLSRNVKPTYNACMAILGVANQPYSTYFQEQEKISNRDTSNNEGEQ